MSPGGNGKHAAGSFQENVPLSQGGGRSLPQILSGASSSSRIGWLRKISRDLMQRPRTSASVIWTILPGRHPRTGGRTRRSGEQVKTDAWSVMSHDLCLDLKLNMRGRLLSNRKTEIDCVGGTFGHTSCWAMFWFLLFAFKRGKKSLVQSHQSCPILVPFLCRNKSLFYYIHVYM